MEQKLETFLTLCETMHYGRAAEFLNLTQPAVSKHIRALENEYGVKLFSYSGRKLAKTKQAERLEQYARSLKYNETALLQQLYENPVNLIRVGATKTIGEYILYPYIQNFLRNERNRLELVVDNTERLLGQLNNGELDFAILEGIFEKSRYDYYLYRMEPYIGICSKEHPFAGREVLVEEVLKERILLREKGSGTRDILERELINLGFKTDSINEQNSISSFELIKALVKDNYGISFLYDAVVKEKEEFAYFTCPPLTGEHELNVVFLKNTDVLRMAEMFLK